MSRRRLGMGFLAIVLLATVCSSGYPVSVVDDRGQEVVFEREPQRVVSLNALYTQILVDLGLEDRLVAIAETDDNPAEVADLPSVGLPFSPNVELILGHEPDLVLGANDWGGERPAIEAAEVLVLTTPWLTDIISIFDTVRTIAKAMDVVSAGDLLVGRIAADIIQAESHALGKPSVTAAFLYAATAQDPPYAAGGDSIESEIILRAGGVNVFSELVFSPQISFEEIIARDPEVIFTDPAHIENVVGNPLMQSVQAVVAGRVYGIRASDIASTRVAEALQAVIAGLYPTDE